MTTLGIEVYCDDEGHTPKVAKVALFLRVESGWRIQTQRLGRYSPRAVANVRQVHRRLTDRGLPVAATESTPPEEGTHDKYELSCNLCGANLQRRAKAVWPVLDRLDGAGMRRISLAGLGAILA